MIERIKDKKEEIAIIIKKGHKPNNLEFLTPDNYNQQLGIMNHSKGKVIQPHIHKQIKREIIGTSETVFVCSGKVEVNLYNRKREKIATRVLREGDIICFISGGHGFVMLEDTILFEVKQGPYLDKDDKVKF